MMGEEMKVKILVLGASPRDLDHVRTNQEYELIESILGNSKLRKELEAKPKLAAPPGEIITSALDHEPKAIHFIGHGSLDKLYFVDEEGDSISITNELLIELFGKLDRSLKYVFFNCCNSSDIAKALTEINVGTNRIDCAIGIDGEIYDDHAMKIAEIFYKSIGAGYSVGTAFGHAETALIADGKITENQVQIHCRQGIDANNIYLVDKSPPPVETDFENLIRDYAKIVAKECWNVPENQNVAAGQLDLDELKNDDIRLDCYVDPQLCWVKQKQVRGNFEENLIELEGSRENQLWHAFQTIRSDGNPGKAKNLVLSDGAGAGKTILTRRLAWSIAEVASRPDNTEPLMVLRFVKPLPKTDFEKLRDLILAKPSLGRLKTSTGALLTMAQKERLIDFALDNRRVVVILDGLDEFSEGQKNAFLNLLKYNAGEFADPVGGDPRKVTTIIAGRQHVIDEHLADSCFHPIRFKRLKIQPFSEELQDEYFHGKGNRLRNDPARNPLAGTRFSKLTWRAVLPENDDTLGELLGLPHTLIQIRQALMNDIEDKSKSELTRYVSQSDLFLHVSDGLLGHAIQKGKVPYQREIGGKPFDTKLMLAEVLGIVAWRMTLSGYEQAVIPDDRAETTSEIERIKVESETRYLLAHPGKKDEFQKAWSLLETIVWNHRGTTESFEAKSLAFRNRRTQELHVARFLTQHAIQADWDELKHNIGDPRFERILLLAAQMPFKSSHRRLGAKKEVYAKTLECIFSRPTNEKHRRPTQVMYKAVDFLQLSWPKEDDLLKSFRDGLIATLKNQLAEEFQAILRGEAQGVDDHDEKPRLKSIAEGIFRKVDDSGSPELKIGNSHIVVLADPADKKFENAKNVGFDDTGKFAMFDAKERVKFKKPFGIHRYAVRNREFQLFDPAQVEDVKSSGRGLKFAGPDQPAIMVNWFDATVFTWFLGEFSENGSQWRWALPTEAQWEYACRAGTDTTWFFGGEDQEAELKKYAWFDGNDETERRTHNVGELATNPCGLYDVLGNVLEWCGDWYAETLEGGTDPTGPAAPSGAPHRVLRGGSWLISGRYCRSAFRLRYTPVNRDGSFGFRLAAVRSEQ